MPKQTVLFVCLLAVGASLVTRAAPQTSTRRPSSAAAAEGTRQARPRAEKPVPFRPGETLTYDVSWSSFLTAATATVSVQDKRPSYGSTAYYIVAEGRPTPLVARLYAVYYKADTLMDVYSLLPQRGSVYSDEGGDRRTRTTLFNQGARTATYEVRTATNTRRSLRLPPETRDPLSAIFALRALPMKPGAKARLPVAENGELLHVDVRVSERQSVQTGLGTVRGWRIVPTIYDAQGQPEVGRRLAIWISDDERRVPLKMEAELAIGTFDFTLRSVNPPLPQ